MSRVILPLLHWHRLDATQVLVVGVNLVPVLNMPATVGLLGIIFLLHIHLTLLWILQLDVVLIYHGILIESQEVCYVRWVAAMTRTRKRRCLRQSRAWIRVTRRMKTRTRGGRRGSTVRRTGHRAAPNRARVTYIIIIIIA
jgi:hypothetical protein